MKKLISPIHRSIAIHLLLLGAVVLLSRKTSSWTDSTLNLGSRTDSSHIQIAWSEAGDGPSQSTSASEGLRRQESDPRPESKKRLSGGGGTSRPSGSLVVPSGSPQYPWISRKTGEQGKVTVGFKLGDNGQATEISIIETSGYSRLDRAAMDFLQETKLTATQPIPAGEPLKLEFIFSLKN
ncbi:MAG: TonB family protein [Bdellovibrionales bacterium]|nr:TonB family protein [Bdellovibrionales bacterium]